MTQIADIIAAKDAAIAVIDTELVHALNLQAEAVDDTEEKRIENNVIQPLLKKRNAIFDQAYERILSSDELQKALNVLHAATDTLKRVAARMNSVTDVLNKVADFLGAADKVIGALKKT